MPSAQPIRFTCGGCGFKIKVSAKHAGRKAKCPDCGSPIVVPKPKPHPKPARPSAGGAIAAAAAPVPKPAPPKDDGFDLDGFELEEPVGYDLNDGDDAGTTGEAEPAWMKHAHAADAQAASLPKLGPTRGNRSEPPSLMRLAKNEKGGLVAVVIFFIPWAFLLVVATGIVSIGTPRDRPTHIAVLLGLSLVTTLITLPIGGWRIWRAWGIMTHGVEIEADLIQYSTPSGNQDASKGTFEYSYDGQTYTYVASLPTAEVEGPHILIVDARNPKRALRKG